DALVDGEAGTAEFGDFVGAGGVGVPVDVLGDTADVVAERAAGFVEFAGEPEDVVLVEDAPDGGEGVVEVEVEAADFAAGGGTVGRPCPSCVPQLRGWVIAVGVTGPP